MAQASFTLCRVPHGERMYWYALFRDPKTGKRTNKKSVEVLKKRLGDYSPAPVTRRSEAEAICVQALEQDMVFRKKDALRSTKELGAYLSHFFDWETSPYIQRRLLLDPQGISKDYMHTRKNLVDTHVVPLLEKGALLSDVSLRQLEDLQFRLVKETSLSKGTVNMAMQAVVMALKEAQRRGDIPATTMLAVVPIKAQPRVRGIMTDEETSSYLAYAKNQDNPRLYLSAALALFTGMRSGELRALTTGQIKPGLIVVDRAYADQQGTKCPKGKKTRVVPCPQFLCDQLLAFAHTNPYRCKETLVFWSQKSGGHVSSHYFCQIFHSCLAGSGILTSEEIERRYITFHSFRHMANTLLRGSVDEYVLRLTIGHSSEQLSDIYTHLSEKAFNSVQAAQRANILPLLQKAGQDGA